MKAEPNRIAVLDNDTAWLQGFAKVLELSLKDPTEVLRLTSIEELEATLTNDVIRESLVLAVVDLELGAGSQSEPGDHLGLTSALPLIRKRAPWLPCILASRWITGNLRLLAVLTPSDFDAILPKEVFSHESFGPDQWRQLRNSVRFRRNSQATGQPSHLLAGAVYAGEWDVSGLTPEVRDRLEAIGPEDAFRCLDLLGMSATSCMLEEAPEGHSGARTLSVYNRPTKTWWFVKLSREKADLQREATRHRDGFNRGIDRSVTVPLYYRDPVVWDRVGAIAYVMERQGFSLKSHVARGGSLDVVLPTLSSLYRGVRLERVFPRQPLLRMVRRLASVPASELPGFDWLHALRENTRHSNLDGSCELHIGAEHGDLHVGNFLVVEERAIVLDFAHYHSEPDGLPLLDLARFLVDLWLRGLDSKIDLPALLNDELSKTPELGPLIKACTSCDCLSSDETSLLSRAIRCVLLEHALVFKSSAAVAGQILAALHIDAHAASSAKSAM